MSRDPKKCCVDESSKTHHITASVGFWHLVVCQAFCLVAVHVQYWEYLYHGLQTHLKEHKRYYVSTSNIVLMQYDISDL